MIDKLKWLASHRGTIMTVLIIALPVVLIVPLPTAVLDILLSTNLALAIMVMLTCMYIDQPLQFNTFPSLLLIVTLFRLVLNVASTRLILSQADAGEVISSFSEFVAGDNLVIGLVIFIILIVIQFIVITKGATRIAEVAARFTLDAMPGKQMAIDADLNSGLIDEDTARARRQEISDEAEFYGAMDGASKFVRGDAIAGIVITLINIIGGIVSGMMLHNLSIVDALNTFVKLSIGDGLVSQIPAFIIAIASGLLVTRSGSQATLGEALVKQIFSRQNPTYIAAGFLGILAFTGLPPMPLLLLAGGLVVIGETLKRSQKAEEETLLREEQARVETESVPKPEKFLDLYTMEMEMGYGMVRLCDAAKGGDLVERIRLIRQQMAQELGFIVPSVRLHDNMQLEANSYVVKIKGVEVARGVCHADSMLAMNTGMADGAIEGIETVEPAFGMKAVWIMPQLKERAEALGYQVVDPTSVLATHLIEILRQHSNELLTRQEVSNLIDRLRERAPRVVEDSLDKEKVNMGDVQRVLQLLLKERVSIRDLESILEVMGDLAPRLVDGSGSLDHESMSELVRMNLGRAICMQYLDDQKTLHVAMLEPRLEDFLIQAVRRSNTGKTMEMAEETRQEVIKACLKELEKLFTRGHAPVLVADPSIRRHLRILLERQLASVVVLSTVEIPSDITLSGEAVILMPASIANVA